MTAKRDLEATPIVVTEVIDVSGPAQELGYACQVHVFPSVVDVVDPAEVLREVRAVLDADPTTTLLRDLVMRGIRPKQPRITRDAEFLERARAGLTTVSADGRILALTIRDVTLLAAVWRALGTLVVMRLDDASSRLVAPLAAPMQLVPTSEPALFLVFEGRRFRITRQPFVIGRHRSCDLQIRDGHLSRKHAAILWRNGMHYLVDLGSHAGLEYRGLRIDNKRIEEGDLFRIGEYALRFTFLETDA